MEKGAVNKKGIALGILLAIFIPILALYIYVVNRSTATPVNIPPKPVIRQEIPASNVTYKGEAGKDALTLLRQKAAIQQDKSGLVTAINSRQADSNKREYWAFYVNGKSASVGPADYQTKDTDTIEWKIEKF